MNSGCAAALDRLQDFCFMAIKAANREPCTPPRSTLILTPAFVIYTELGIDPVEACFKVIAPNAAHIFCLNHPDFPGLYICNQVLPSGTVKVSAAPSIIRIMFAVGETMFISVVLQIALLRQDLSRVVSAKMSFFQKQ